MNVLIFLEQDNYIGGAQNVLHQIGEFYLEKGYNVHVLFLFKKSDGLFGEQVNNRLKLYHGGSLLKFIVNILVLRKMVFDFSYTSLVSFTGILGFLRRLHIIKIHRMIGRESTMVFERFHGFKLWRKKVMYYLGYPALDLLVCQTNRMKEQLKSNIPWIENHSKIIVVPNPVNMNAMRSMGMEEIDTSSFEPYVVSAGRFIKEKGFDILIDAFTFLHRNHPDLKLVLLGNGPEKKTIEDKIEYLNMKDYIKMMGFTKNVFPWFRKAKMCVVSSKVEGFPNVLLQMMSQNERVVSTNCAGDIRRIKGIYSCEVNSPTKLKRTMEECLLGDISNNRILFDTELESRTINNFIEHIEKEFKPYNRLNK